MKKIVSIISLVGASLGIAAFAFADSDHPRAPPPEAFAACTDSKEGDACAVKLRDRSLDGKCQAFEDKRLFCMPNEMPPPPPSGTPIPTLPS
jgi:hypothetical protein